MSKCKVDPTALKECQESFEKFATLLKQINDDNIAYRKRSEDRNFQISQWDDQHRLQLQRLEAGKTASPGHVFMPDGSQANCATLGASDCYIGAQCNCFDGRVSEAQRRCTSCGFKKCDCTAGTGGSCQTPCAQLTHSAVSTYQGDYNNWLIQNPRPAPLPPYTPLSVNAGDMICAQCTQCQEFAEIQAQNISFDNVSQAMQCVGKMQNKLDADKTAEAAAAAKAASDKKAAEAAEAGKKRLLKILLVLVLIVAIVIAIVLVLISRRKSAGEFSGEGASEGESGSVSVGGAFGGW
jgi:hypothetical protein